VFGVGLNMFLSLFWSLQKPVLPIPPSSLRQFKNYVAADLKISSENCVPADFWQRKTASLPIQEIDSAIADSEIGSQNCVATDRFRNRQRWWSHQFHIYIYSFGCLHSPPLNMNFVLKI